jgi:hypothetical protein
MRSDADFQKGRETLTTPLVCTSHQRTSCGHSIFPTTFHVIKSDKGHYVILKSYCLLWSGSTRGCGLRRLLFNLRSLLYA